jgi:ribonuclease Z
MQAENKNALYIIGAGTPTPTPTRFGTAYVLQVGREYLMIDCGPAATHKLVRTGLWPTWIDTLLITHHHFDHNADLPCFLLTRWDQSTGRENPLKIFGPPPTAEIVQKLVGPGGAYADDWMARVKSPLSQHVHRNRGGSLPRPEPHFEIADVQAGFLYETPNWKVSAVEVHHVEPWLISLAYRVDTAHGSIVFAGDTGAWAPVVELAQGADVFVANSWNHQRFMDHDGEAPGRTGTLDAARFARDSGAKKLILAHIGPELSRPGSRERGIADIAALYDGEIIFSEEGMALELWGN